MRHASTSSQDGQALIESCLVITLTALVLFGALQLSQVLAAREILEHAAARGARARTVGFNQGMVRRVVEVAAIPNAGRISVPAYENINPLLRRMVAEAVEDESRRTPGVLWSNLLQIAPISHQARLELARIPEYLAAQNEARARYVLNYTDWNAGEGEVRHWSREASDAEGASITHVHTEQNFRLWVPMHRTFYAADRIPLAGDAYVETHYPLYLEDQGW